jgi:prolyl-tRNA synthetase
VVLVVRDEEGAGDAARRLATELADRGVRVEVDDRTDQSFGRRAVDWELKGVPVRVEVGPRDVAAGTVTLVRRIPGSKEPVAIPEAAIRVAGVLDDDQRALFQEALDRRDTRTVDVASAEDAMEAARDGFARVPWNAVRDQEDRLAEGGATVRCLQRADGGIPLADDEPDLVAVVARAY